MRYWRALHLLVIAIAAYGAYSIRPYWPPTPVSHDRRAVDPAKLHGSGRIYLITMGRPRESAFNLTSLAQWLRAKYGIDARLLPAMDLEPSAWNFWRRQYKAEALLDQLKRAHPDLANDPQAYLFGVTDEDMYTIWTDWSFTFTQRDEKRAAVLSAARMDASFGEKLRVWLHLAPPPPLDAQARMRRILLKDVAVLFWHLPLNNDPGSVLAQPMDPDVAPEDIHESDLDPDKTAWGRSEGTPCVFFAHSSATGIKRLDGPVVQSCGDLSRFDQIGEDTEVFQLNLADGSFLSRHTDFYIPGSIPLRLTRTTADYPWPFSMGLTTMHNYDRLLATIDMSIVRVVDGDVTALELKRSPPGRGFLPFAKYVPLKGSFATLRWRSSPYAHFELTQADGSMEDYLPCDKGTPPCYLTGYRSSSGEQLRFERDGNRRLLRVTAPAGAFLHFDYDDHNRVTTVSDSRGRVTHYGYDGQGRLASVAYPSGEVFSYQYDAVHHLVALYVAPAADRTPKLVLRNDYENGFLTRQTLADGSVFRYSYSPLDKTKVHTIVVTPPSGAASQVIMRGWDSVVREVP